MIYNVLIAFFTAVLFAAVLILPAFDCRKRLLLMQREIDSARKAVKKAQGEYERLKECGAVDTKDNSDKNTALAKYRFAKKRLVESVTNYNAYIENFPENIFSGLFGFKKQAVPEDENMRQEG